MFLCSTKFPVTTRDVWIPVNSVLMSGFYVCLYGEMNDVKGRLLNVIKVFSVACNVCIVLVIIWLLVTLEFVGSLEDRPWKAWRGACSGSSYCLKTTLPNEMCQNPPGSSKVIITLNVYGSSNQMSYSQFIFKSCELLSFVVIRFTSQELLVLLIFF